MAVRIVIFEASTREEIEALADKLKIDIFSGNAVAVAEPKKPKEKAPVPPEEPDEETTENKEPRGGRPKRTGKEIKARAFLLQSILHEEQMAGEPGVMSRTLQRVNDQLIENAESPISMRTLRRDLKLAEDSD